MRLTQSVAWVAVALLFFCAGCQTGRRGDWHLLLRVKNSDELRIVEMPAPEKLPRVASCGLHVEHTFRPLDNLEKVMLVPERRYVVTVEHVDKHNDNDRSWVNIWEPAMARVYNYDGTLRYETRIGKPSEHKGQRWTYLAYDLRTDTVGILGSNKIIALWHPESEQLIAKQMDVQGKDEWSSNSLVFNPSDDGLLFSFNKSIYKCTRELQSEKLVTTDGYIVHAGADGALGISGRYHRFDIFDVFTGRKMATAIPGRKYGVFCWAVSGKRIAFRKPTNPLPIRPKLILQDIESGNEMQMLFPWGTFPVYWAETAAVGDDGAGESQDLG
jgi:hypothetical protein